MTLHRPITIALLSTLAIGAAAPVHADDCSGGATIVFEGARAPGEMPMLAPIFSDDRLDIVSLDTAKVLRIYRNTGATFELAGTVQMPPFSSIVEIVDFDNDGRPDLLIQATNSQNCGSNLVRIYWNSAGPKAPFNASDFTNVPMPASPFCIQSIGIDFDGDGLLDVLLPNMSMGSTGTSHMVRNLGNRSFQVVASYPLIRDLYVREGRDLDGDGIADFTAFVRSGWTGGGYGMYFYRGTGTGTLQAPIINFAQQRSYHGFSFQTTSTERSTSFSVAVHTGVTWNETLHLGQWSPSGNFDFVTRTLPPTLRAWHAADLRGTGNEDLVLVSADSTGTLGVIWNDGGIEELSEATTLVQAPGFTFFRAGRSEQADGERVLAVGGSSSLLRVFAVDCEPTIPCPGDLNNDGVVNGADISVVLGFWGLNGKPVAADINGDGIVDGADLAILLSGWGDCL